MQGLFTSDSVKILLERYTDYISLETNINNLISSPSSCIYSIDTKSYSKFPNFCMFPFPLPFPFITLNKYISQKGSDLQLVLLVEAGHSLLIAMIYSKDITLQVRFSCYKIFQLFFIP